MKIANCFFLVAQARARDFKLAFIKFSYWEQPTLEDCGNLYSDSWKAGRRALF